MPALVVAAVVFILACWVLMLRKGRLRRGVETFNAGEPVGAPGSSVRTFRCGFQLVAPGDMVATNPLAQCRVDETDLSLVLGSTRYARFERTSARVTQVERRLLVGRIEFEDEDTRALVTPNDWEQFVGALDDLGWRTAPQT